MNTQHENDNIYDIATIYGYPVKQLILIAEILKNKRMSPEELNSKVLEYCNGYYQCLKDLDFCVKQRMTKFNEI